MFVPSVDANAAPGPGCFRCFPEPEVRMFVPSVADNAAPSPRCFSRTGGEDFCPLRADDHDAWRVHRASGEFAFE